MTHLFWKVIPITLGCFVLTSTLLQIHASDVDRVQGNKDLVIKIEEKNPWTNLGFNDSPDNYQFVIISDRTAPFTKGLFRSAIDKVNLISPAFVMSVGDLIQCDDPSI